MMRKHLLSMLLLLMSSIVAFAAKEDTYKLYTGFEDGVFPEGWTQEYVSGETSWVVEKADTALYPSSVAAGNYRLLLRNTTSETLRFTTRLISPVIDLNGVTLPVLMFSHVQQQRTGDVDTLRVYYRSTENSRWVLLATYPNAENTKYTKWTDELIDLPAQSGTYQLMFEGTDNFGRGIGLDEIIVRPYPTCDVPSNLTANNLSTTTATLSWLASLDADSIEVVLASEELDLDNIKVSAILLHDFTTQFNYPLTKLTRNTVYYWYVNSWCSGQESGWAGSSFRTKNLASIPYKQGFNLNYISGSVAHMAYMTQGTSILREDNGEMEFMPYVNQNTTDANCKSYSFDSTRCYVFAGKRSSVTASIPAGEYVYGATPEMDAADVRKLSVSFWGTSERYVDSTYAAGIIVGVMTNPEDFNTFVAVDTCYMTQQYEHNRFVVDLKDYAGIVNGNGEVEYGKYIAFASNFKEKRNLFYVDNIVVDYSNNVNIPKGLSYSNVDYDELTVNVADLGNATAWNLYVSDKFDYSGDVPASVIYEQKNITGNSITIQADTLVNKILYLYAQGVNGENTSIVSLPKGVKMPRMLDSIPYEIVFNSATLGAKSYDPLEINPFVRSNTNRTEPWDVIVSPTDPVSRLPWFYSSHPSMTMTYVGEYMAMPAVKNLNDVYLSFSIRPYYSSEGYGYEDDVRVALGVMTDPLDINTFDSITYFDGTGTMNPATKKCSYDFSNYTGTGKYIAFKYILPKSEKDNRGMAIMRVSILPQGTCPRPFNVQVDASSTSVNLSWSENSEGSYRIRLFPTVAKSTAIDTTKILADTLVTGLAVTLEGLNSYTAYYYQIAAVCGEITSWTDEVMFRTECYQAEPIPYSTSFEKETAGGQLRQYPNCWTGAPWRSWYAGGGSSESLTYYPYISSSSTYAHSGSNSLIFGYGSSSSYSYTAKDLWLALPEMSAEVKDLQLTAWLRPSLSGYQNDSIEIGLIPVDATDLTNFEHIAWWKVPGAAQYTEFITRMDTYTGTSVGKRICIVPRSAVQHYYYIDDIVVDSLKSCAKITDVEISDMNASGAKISWTSPTASEWEVIVAKDTLQEIAFDTISRAAIDSTVILSWETVNTNPYVFSSENAEANVTYYVYVRGLCDGTYSEWSNMATFSTMCVASDITTYSEDFSNAANADCWTRGMRTGTLATTNAVFNSNGYFYMFNASSNDGVYGVMPPMDVEDMSKYQISFDAHGGTTTSYLKEVTVGIITNASDLTTFEPMATLKLNQVASTAVTANNGFNEAYRYTVRFSEYEGDWRGNMGNRVMFLSESGDKANYIYIDNVNFDTICSVLEPLEAWAVEAGMDYAVLTWDTVGTKYEVKVSSKRIDPATEIGDKYDATVEANGIRVEGLDMLTQYFVYVRTIGADGKTSPWSNVRWFSTQCPPSYSLPYKNDFSGKVVHTSAPYDGPDCWTLYYDGAEGAVANNRMYASANRAGTVTADNGLYMGSTYGSSSTAPKTSYAVLPVIDTDMSKAMIEFDWRTSVTTVADASKRNLAIGIAEVAEPLDSMQANVQWLDTLNTGENYGTWIHEMVPLNKYVGDGKYIVLSQFGGNGGNGTATTVVYIYLDNLQVVTTPEVFAPATIECGKTFGSTAELTWTQTLGDYSEWQVVAVKTGEEIPENPTVQTFTDTKGTFTGLQGATDYEFYVRAVSGDKVSPWVATPAKGTTLYLVEVEDAFWNFDSQATQEHYNNSTYWKEKGWLQGMIRGTFSNLYVPYCYNNTINSTSKLRTSWYSFSGDTCLHFYSTSTYAGYTVMPQINCNLDSMQLRFKINATYCNENTKAVTATYARGTYDHSIKIGYMTDPYDYSTFKEITTYNYDFPQTGTFKIDDDPTGNRFYKEVIIPLYGVGEGNYIVFSNDFPNNQVYIDDVRVEKETGCAVPVQAKLTDLTFNKETRRFDATFTWGSAKQSWNVKVLNTESGLLEIEQNNLTEMTYKAEGLAEQTTYKFSVQANCDEGETSDWVDVTFTTPCTPTAEEAAVWNLNSDYYQFGTSSTYIISNCWKSGLGTGTAVGNFPYLLPNGTTATGYNYARTQEDGDYSLRFYTTATVYDAYAALPEMDFDLDSMTLHFWGRAAYFFKETHTTATSKGRLYAVNSTYLRKLVIGAMTDVNDFSTFTPIDTITYDKVWSGTVTTVADRFLKDDKSGNGWWQEYAIPLAKYAGKGHIAIVAPKPTAASYFWVDDIEIVKGTFCTAASNVRLTDLQSRQATIAWDLPEDATGSVDVALYIAINGKQPTDSLVQAVNVPVSTSEYTFTNLLPGRDYYYSVKHKCSDDEEAAWSNPTMFTCNYEAPRFSQDFDNLTSTIPVDWYRYGGSTTTSGSGVNIQYINSAENVINGGTMGTLLETASGSSAWRLSVGTNANKMYTTLVKSAGSGTSQAYAWLITPRISLQGIAPDNNMMLSFDLSMWNSTRTGAPEAVGTNDRFMVLISLDGMNTWTKEDSWSWRADGNGDFDLNLVQNEEKTWYIDLTKYVGKSVNIAFYLESHCAGYSGTGNYFYLDNVQLNTFTKTEYDADICRWEDYSDNTFAFDAYDLSVGATTYDDYVPAKKAGINDHLTILNLTVNTDTTVYFEATRCEGSDYIENGFHLENLVQSGIYKRKLSGVNHCDSIVELHLTVIPTIRKDLEVTICQGTYYEFKGEKYYTTTTITETFEAKSGCDSVVTLYLTVNEALRGEPEDVYLCPNTTYKFTDKYPEISEAGLYVDTIQNIRGCDSIVTLNVYNVQNGEEKIRAAICEGNKYDVYPFRGLSRTGDYVSVGETVHGCDSIVTLHLLVAEGGTMTDKVKVEELPYVLNGVQLFDENTPSGVITTTVNLECGDVTLVLTVGEVSGLNSTFVNTLALAPNPVNVGEQVKVLSQFTQAELSQMVVEVFGSTGELVSRTTPKAAPVVVEPLNVAGVYLVRITSGDKLYQAKLVVK